MEEGSLVGQDSALPAVPRGCYACRAMSAAAVDTLRIARNLEAAGVERRQAEAHAEALRVVADASREDLATKGDIAMLGAKIERLEGRIDGLAVQIDGLAGRIDGMHRELVTIRWSLGLVAAFVFAIGLRVFGVL